MNDDPQTQSDIKLRLLGTGGPWLNPDRWGPSALISIGDQRILVDAGRGAAMRLVQAGEDPATLTAILLTHHHLDHISDLGDIIITSWLRGRKTELVIYGPTGTEAIVEALLTQVYAKDIEWRSDGEPAWGGWRPVRAVDIPAGEILHFNGWRVRPEEVVHGNGLPFRAAFLDSWKCYGYRFEIGDKVIAISGDTIDCEGIRKVARDADLLVHCCFATDEEVAESEHLTGVATHTLATSGQVANVAKSCGVNHLILTHLRPKPPEQFDKMKQEVRRIFQGTLTVGEDLIQFHI